MKSFLKLIAVVGVLVLGAALGRWSVPVAEPVETEEVHIEDAVPPPDSVVIDVETQVHLGLESARVELRTMDPSPGATAVVGPDETRLGHVRPLTLGRVLSVHVRPGDRVVLGDALVTYDNLEIGDLGGQLEAAVSAIETANAEMEAVRNALERARTLVEIGALPEADLETREARYAGLAASLRAHSAERVRIEEKLRRFGVEPVAGEWSSEVVLRAPFGGVITEYEVAEGETITPEDRLMTLTDLDTVWVQADLYERDLRSVSVGDRATVRVAAYPDDTFEGRVTYIGDVIDPETRTARARIEVANPEHRLKLGMFANVRFTSDNLSETMAIPTGAVQTVEGQPVAFVRDSEDGFLVRPLVTGSEVGGWIEVLDGLEAGETIVTSGSFALKSALLSDELGGGHH
jgi:cobalt-zinc-cadmium efflux system membrane fusion protein